MGNGVLALIVFIADAYFLRKAVEPKFSKGIFLAWLATNFLIFFGDAFKGRLIWLFIGRLSRQGKCFLTILAHGQLKRV